jgi:hypothetical protein
MNAYDLMTGLNGARSGNSGVNSATHGCQNAHAYKSRFSLRPLGL